MRLRINGTRWRRTCAPRCLHSSAVEVDRLTPAPESRLFGNLPGLGPSPIVLGFSLSLLCPQPASYFDRPLYPAKNKTRELHSGRQRFSYIRLRLKVGGGVPGITGEFRQIV